MERVFGRVLPAFAVFASVALASCGGGGSGAGSIPVTTNPVTAPQSVQTVDDALFGTDQVEVRQVDLGPWQTAGASLNAMPGGASLTQLPDGYAAHIMPVMSPGHAIEPAPLLMTYHGGPIEKSPKQVLVFWGFGSCNTAVPPVCSRDPNHTSEILVNFLRNVGGSKWMSVTTQYFSTAQGHITNPINTLNMKILIDLNTAPLHPTALQVGEQALGAQHFLGLPINKDINYVMALGHGVEPPGFKTTFCAFHNAVSPNGNPPFQPFTEMPYVTEAGTGCGAFSVSGANDGVSITLGHEAAETITDPLGSAWFDSKGAEIGDKCAFMNLGNTTLRNGDVDPVQPLWSNSAAKCVRL